MTSHLVPEKVSVSYTQKKILFSFSLVVLTTLNENTDLSLIYFDSQYRYLIKRFWMSKMMMCQSAENRGWVGGWKSNK